MLELPAVIHRDQNGNERAVSLTTRLLQDRIVLCQGEIRDELAESVTAQLLYLASENPDEPITMVINSQGGSVTAGLAIIDIMESISCPVYTVISGLSASMGIVIAASGEKGHRRIYPSARVMIHQVSGGYSGNVQDARVNYKEMERINDVAMERLAKCCGKDAETLKSDSQRDLWLNAQEAIDYGCCDEIVKKRK